MENYKTSWTNIFIASSGVLLILGTLKEAGIDGVEAYDIAKASILWE